MGLRIVRFRNDEISKSLSVVMERISELVQFDSLLNQAHKQAKETGLRPADIQSAVAKERDRKQKKVWFKRG